MPRARHDEPRSIVLILGARDRHGLSGRCEWVSTVSHDRPWWLELLSAETLERLQEARENAARKPVQRRKKPDRL